MMNRAGVEYAVKSGADLQSAYLQGANLQGANLQVAYLRGANLQGAELQVADLQGADLRGANLRGAVLQGADLRGAGLRGADLRDADLRDVKGIQQTYVAAEGELIGYKKLYGGVICKLLIPAGAKRSNATTRKCRAEYAIVLEGEGGSICDPSFSYKVGETVRPVEPFDEDRWAECASGIHFFITREEAEEYC